MRRPTRVLWICMFAAALIATLLVVRWNGAEAQGPRNVVSASVVNGAPAINLSASGMSAAAPARHALQDVALTVARECPAVLLEDGSLSVTVTVSSPVAVSGVAVLDDAGTPDLPADDVPLVLLDGSDLDADGVLDPDELWTYSGAFIPAAGAIGDTVYSTGSDETAVVIQGFAACEALPALPPPPPSEETDQEDAAPTATAETTENGSEPTDATQQAEAAAQDEGERGFTVAAAEDVTPTVTKGADSTEILAGENVVFTMTITNPGPDPIYNVELFDSLPTGGGFNWTITSEVTTFDSCELDPSEGLQLFCTVATLADGETVSVQITSPTTEQECGSIFNGAHVEWAVAPENEVSDGFIDSNFVRVDVICPAVSVDKEPAEGGETINAGDDAVFDITVGATNDTAHDVHVDDTLPAGPDWSTTSPGCDISGDQFTCNFSSIEPGSPVTVAVTGQTDADDCGDLSNAVSATGSTGSTGSDFSAAQVDDPRTDAATITVNCPDIRVVKSPDDGTVSAGEDAVFTIQVFNDGEGDAYDVDVDDELPAGFDWSVNRDDCDIITESGLDLDCDFDLAAGGSETITLTAPTTRLDCGPPITNEANATAENEPEDAPGANTDSGSITVLCPNLELQKTPDDGIVTNEAPIAFTITVTNNGAGDAIDVDITDDLPGGITWTADNSECDISAETGDLSCDDLTIPGSGGTFTVTVSGQTNDSVCDLALTNSATVRAPNEPEATEGDNTDTGRIEVHCPNVEILKAGIGSDLEETDAIDAGEAAVFDIVVDNVGAGLGTATGVTVTDNLPPNVHWSELQDPRNLCEITMDVGGQTLRCEVDSLENRPAEDEEIFVRVGAETDSSLCGETPVTLTNTATVTAENEPEGNTDNNEATASIAIQCPALAIDKEPFASEISAGETAAYTITVSNNGDGTASNVVLTDTLPAGVVWTENPETLCEIAGQELTCNIGTMGPAETDTSTFNVTVEGVTDAPDCAAPLTNTATVTATDQTPVSTDPITITVNCPDLAITKTAAADTVNVGETASYTITVNNGGPGAAQDVTLDDTLPAGVAWSLVSGEDCAIDAGVLTCQPRDLGPNEEFAVTVEGTTVPANCETPLANTATADASNDDPSDDPISAGPATITVNCPELTIAKTAAADAISAGETASYTITVTNVGPAPASEVVLSDTLPTGVAWAENPDTLCSLSDGELTCDIGPLGAAGSDTDSFTVTVEGVTDQADCAAPLSNTATVESAETAPESSDPVTITVSCAELLITKDAGDAEIGAGETASYTITVSNIGEGTAFGVTVEDTLPAGIAWTFDNESCAIDGGTLFCDFGNLPPDGSAAVTISGETGPEDCGDLSNTATADAADADAVTTDQSVITIGCPDVAMTKTADAAEVEAGNPIGFTLTVTNPQVATASGVSVTDELPAVAGLSWSIDGGANAAACDIGDGVLSCDFGDIPGGQSRTVHIASPTTTESCGTIENTATTEADNEPADLDENNTATATITVDCAAISLLKLATDDLGTEITTADVGDTITYVYLVANTGAVELTDISVLDDHFPVEGNLCPAGTTLAPDDGVAGSGPDEIVCAAGYLVGEIDITDADGLTLTNTATATGVTPLGTEISATDDTTVTINEPKEPCEFPVTFTFVTDIDFVDDDGNVLFTMPAGTTFTFNPGAVNEQGGCTMPFNVTGPGGTALGAGTMSIYIQSVVASGGVRALVTEAVLVAEVTEVTAWAVPGVPAPEPEVEEVKATIVVSGPVLEVDAGEASATIVVEPELEVPFVKTETYTISKPEPPNTGAGSMAAMTTGSGFGALGGLLTMLPALAAVTWRRRRALGR